MPVERQDLAKTEPRHYHCSIMGSPIDSSEASRKLMHSGRSINEVYVVDDHPVFREGMARIINRKKDLMVCGQAGDAEHALSEIERLQPAIVLVDLSLPGKSGLDLIKAIRERDRTVKLLVVSMHDEAIYATRVLKAGGDGYVMKEEDPEEIINAIRDVLAGHIYVSEAVLAEMEPQERGATPRQTPLHELSDAELATLEMVGHAKTNTEIAEALRLDVSTVEAQCAEIKRKLKLTTDIELIRYAVCWVETEAD